MSGSDFLWWLEDIWFDLMNLGTADLPSLFFRLALLVIGGTILLRVTVAVTRNVVFEFFAPAIAAVLRAIWRTLTAPVWVPYRLVRRIVRRVQDRRRLRAAQAWEQQRREEKERERRDEETRERERLAALERMLRPD